VLGKVHSMIKTVHVWTNPPFRPPNSKE